MATDLTIMEDSSFLVPYVDERFLAEWKETTTALADTAYLGELWAKSKTPWFIENITISWPSDIMNMRYIAAQLEAKRMALMEAKYSLLEKQVDVKEAEDQLSREKGDTVSSQVSAERLMIRIARLREEIGATLIKFRGAMEEVAVYKALHDELKKEVGELTQEQIDALDHRAQLLRALMQSVRSVRMSNRIDAGNQEFLEQCKCNPLWAQNKILDYLTHESQGPAIDAEGILVFINALADEVLK